MLLNKPQLQQVLLPEFIPFPSLPGHRHMQLPVSADADGSAVRANEKNHALWLALQLAATEAGQCSVAHGAPNAQVKRRAARPLECVVRG